MGVPTVTAITPFGTATAGAAAVAVGELLPSLHAASTPHSVAKTEHRRGTVSIDRREAGNAFGDVVGDTRSEHVPLRPQTLDENGMTPHSAVSVNIHRDIIRRFVLSVRCRRQRRV